MTDAILNLSLLMALSGHSQQLLHLLLTSERLKADTRSWRWGDDCSADISVISVVFVGINWKYLSG